MKYILIYLLNLADYALTIYLTGLYGIACEVNPPHALCPLRSEVVRHGQADSVSASASLDVANEKRRCGVGGAGDVYRCCFAESQPSIHRVKLYIARIIT